jgi:hypothetical protein
VCGVVINGPPAYSDVMGSSHVPPVTLVVLLIFGSQTDVCSSQASFGGWSPPLMEAGLVFSLTPATPKLLEV